MTFVKRVLEFIAAHRAEAAFKRGFNSEATKRLKRFDVPTVRRLYETNQLSAIEHNVAEILLVSNERAQARRNVALLAMTAIGLLVTIANLAVNLTR